MRLILLALGLLLAVWIAVRGLRMRARAGAGEAVVEIPVLGPRGAGKTLFIARLVHALLHRPATGEGSTWVAHLLTDHEERRLRGHALDDASPGLRSTRDLVAAELGAFGEGSGNSPTPVPEHAYLRIYRKAQGGKGPPRPGVEGVTWGFVEVPGSYLEATDQHEANLYPRLAAAHGLILVVDAARLDPASETHRIAEHYDLYAEVIAKAVEHCRRPQFPLWLALTKADRLVHPLGGLAPGVVDPQVLDDLLPRLAHLPVLVADRVHRLATLTDSAVGDAATAATLVETCGRMLDALVTSLGVEGARARRRRRLGAAAAGLGVVLALLFGVLLLRQWSLDHLPRIEAGERPGLAALDEAAAALLAHRGNPLFFIDIPDIDRRLGGIEAEYHRLLGEGREAWWGDFARLRVTPAPTPIGPIVTALDVELGRLRAFVDRPFPAADPTLRARAQGWIREAQALRQWLAEWEASAGAGEPRLRLLHLTALTIPPRREVEPNTAERVLAQAAELAEAALVEAGRVSALPAEGDYPLSLALAPLRAWRDALAGEGWARVLATPAGTALLGRLEALRGEAWTRIWGQVASALGEAGGPRAVAARLRRFKEDQEASGEPMPASVEQAWKAAIDQLIGGWPVSPEVAEAEAQGEFAAWVSPYLDGTGEARLALKALEREIDARLRRLVAGAQAVGGAEAAGQDITAHAQRRALGALAEWLAQGLAQITQLPSASVLTAEVDVWRERLDALEQLTARQEYRVRFVEVTCSKGKLDRGYAEGWLDFYEPYLRLTVGGEVVQEAIIDLGTKDPEIALRWGPWDDVQFGFYDRDGETDVVGSPGDDDILVATGGAPQTGVRLGFASLWRLTEWAGDACRLAAVVEPTVPEWMGYAVLPAFGGEPPRASAGGEGAQDAGAGTSQEDAPERTP